MDNVHHGDWLNHITLSTDGCTKSSEVKLFTDDPILYMFVNNPIHNGEVRNHDLKKATRHQRGLLNSAQVRQRLWSLAEKLEDGIFPLKSRIMNIYNKSNRTNT